MHKTITLFLLTTIVFFSLHIDTTFAVSEKEQIEKLTLQFNALNSYVTRITTVWNPSVQKAVPSETVRTSITDGIFWLVKSQEENGHFAYEYVPYEDVYKNDDNIVRQAGALYALGEVARKSKTENKDTNGAIEKSIRYFESLSTEHEFEGENIRCIQKSERSKLCKLGATSLALVGILGYVEANPKKAKDYEDLIEGYVAFILKAKKEKTGFRDQYEIGEGFRGETESSFSNGEALLALVRYYDYKQNGDVKKVIDETFMYLKVQPYDANLYLWMMASLKDMHVLWPSDAYTTYGKAFTLWRMNMMQSAHMASHNYCAANEGLASAYSLLKGNMTVAEAKKLRTEIDFWNTKNIGLQIGLTEKLRVVNEEGKLLFKTIRSSEKSGGGFLTSEKVPTQRIDFTQHCVNTYLQTLVDIDNQTL